MSLNVNLPAIRAQLNIARADRKLNLAMQRMSSGLKINSVADDSAGLAIVNKIKNQISGMTMAGKNSLDGISMAETAEGALNESQSIVQKIRELSLQASTDTLTGDDRAKIQTEISELLNELDSITDKTEFNKTKLLGGNAGRMGLSGKSGFTAQNISEAVYISEKTSAFTLTYSISAFGTPPKVTGGISSSLSPPAGSFRINGETVTVAQGDTADTVIQKLREAASYSDIEIVTPGYPGVSDLILVGKTAGSNREIDLQPPDSIILSALGLAPGKTRGTDAAISDLRFFDKNGQPNAKMSAESILLCKGNRVEISGANGEKTVLDLKLDRLADGSFAMKNGTLVSDSGVAQNGPVTDMSLKVTEFGPLVIQIGANKSMQIELNIPNMGANALGISDINVKTLKGAQAAITACDNALNAISAVRTTLGTFINRLEHTVSSLAVAGEAAEKSRSRIEDTDMALEMTSYTQLNILSQAGISILAQANQRPQQLLQLIGK